MWNARLSFRHRWLWVAAGVAALVIVLAYTAAFLIDEPLRRSIERRMNAQLKGYTVRLGGASFHPHGFSLDLFNLVVVQDANPDPAVMRIARLGASVQWRGLIHAPPGAAPGLDPLSPDPHLPPPPAGRQGNTPP